MSARASGPALLTSGTRTLAMFTRITGLTVAVWVAAAMAAAMAAATADTGPIAVAGAFAVGWSHLAGRCGLSHLGALTPQGKVAGQRRRWLSNVMVYLAAGTLASAAVGAILGVVGSLLVPSPLRGPAFVAVAALAVVAAGSEVGLIPWRLPEPNRQTRRDWSQRYRAPIPAALWGFGLGVTIATVFTFAGTWLVLTLPVARGEPALGALLLVAHWLGRATPVLAGPALLDHAAKTADLLDEVERRRPLFRATNVIGIGLLGVAAVLMINGPFL